MKKIKCFGCGAWIENVEGQPHEYIGAPQGCWNLYEQILVKEFGEFNYPELTHRLTVDTYAIQHPGVPSRKSIQSVNIHLISLFYIFIKNNTGKQATKKMSEILAKEPTLEWLEPPIPNGQKTVIDVLKAKDKLEHEKFVREWAENVWECWLSKHKEKIERLAKL
jgi:Family of unknown function (DUF5946)